MGSAISRCGGPLPLVGYRRRLLSRFWTSPYPFRPVVEIPSTRSLWKKTKNRKVGTSESTLMANIGLSQLHRNGEREKPLITSGNDVEDVARFVREGALCYTASDVIEYLLRDVDAPRSATGASCAVSTC